MRSLRLPAALAVTVVAVGTIVATSCDDSHCPVSCSPAWYDGDASFIPEDARPSESDCPVCADDHSECPAGCQPIFA